MKRTPIVRKTPLKRGGRIAPVSARRRKRDAGYPAQWAKRAEYANGMCEGRVSLLCRGVGSEAHHVAGRLGPDPHRLDNLRWLCRPCHAHVHEQPAMAYLLGLSVRRNTNRTETS